MYYMSTATIVGVQQFIYLIKSLMVFLAAQSGSEEQKDKYLPSLSKLHKVCAYVSERSILIGTLDRIRGPYHW